MLSEHEIGGNFKCDDCEFVEMDRGKLKEHVKEKQSKDYEIFGGNCSGRLYEENSFTGGKCNTFLCIICSRTEPSKDSLLDPVLSYCSACARD